jgi:hypothetical protein
LAGAIAVQLGAIASFEIRTSIQPTEATLGREKMWTLILVVIVAASGGVSANTTFLDFPLKDKCEAAAAALAVEDYATLPNTSGDRPPTFYRIVAKCVAR